MISKNIHHADTNPGISSSFDFRNRLAQTGGQNNVNQIRGINRQGSTGSGIPKHVTNVSTSIANASTGSTSTITVIFSRDPSDANFSGVTVFVKGYQGNPAPVQIASGTDSPITFIVNNTGEALSLIVQAFGNGGTAPLGTAPTVGISLPKSTGGGTGTTTVTQTPIVSGTAAVGQLAKFATTTTLTGANLSQDVTTSGGTAATVVQIQTTPVVSTAPQPGQYFRYDKNNSRWGLSFPRRFRQFQYNPSNSGALGAGGENIGFAPATTAAIGAAITTTEVVGTTAEGAGSKNVVASSAGSSRGLVTIFQASSNASSDVFKENLGILRFRLSLNQATQGRWWMGLLNLGSSVSPTTANVQVDDIASAHCIAFRFSNAPSAPTDSVWKGYTRDGTTANVATGSGTGSTPDTSVHDYVIAYDGTSALFYVDGTLICSSATHLPTAAMNPFVACDNLASNPAILPGVTLYTVYQDFTK